MSRIPKDKVDKIATEFVEGLERNDNLHDMTQEIMQRLSDHAKREADKQNVRLVSFMPREDINSIKFRK